MSDVYEHLFAAGRQADDLHGVMVAIVTNNQDPLGLGRVKVRFPALTGDVESQWARIVGPGAGANRGWYWLPDLDDEVLVCFEGGRFELPLILGSLWNGKDKPPESNADGKNARHLVKTRGGHTIVLDDTENEQTIAIADMHGNRLVISSRDNAITLSAEGDIVLQSHSGTISLRATTVDIQSTDATRVQAGSAAEIQGSSEVKIRGAVVNIN
jgi:uncharacterized protein involved in type VI secretion and phage assembly